MCTLLPFKEQIIVQQGSEGQHRRQHMCILESPWSRASESSNANWPWFRRWAHQVIALLIVITIHAYICDGLDKYVANTGPPVSNFRPLGQTKKIKKTHTVWANEPKLSQFSAKWKPTRNLSQLTLTLTQELITMGINRALKSKLCFKPWRKTHLWKLRYESSSPVARKLHLIKPSKSGIRNWYSGSFPQENLVLNPITVHW